MSHFDDLYARFCDGLDSRGRRRVLREMGPTSDGRTLVAGRALINFSSNDYLGLSRHPALIERAVEWAQKWGAGSTASRLVCGNLEPYGPIEEKIARGKGAEAALVLATGFQANGALLPALFDRRALGGEPLVFSDWLNHASIHHGCRAAGVEQIRFRHNDMNHLESLLKERRREKARRFILTESVFSMDGDRADLPALLDLADRFGAFLYLDEAHATGVLGPSGFGLSASFPGRMDLVMGTFGKALGSFGAYAVCSKSLREYLVNRCAGLIYSTALPPAVLGAIDAALELLPSLEEERCRLQENAARVREAFTAGELDCARSSTQIVPAILGSEQAVLAMGHALEAEGILGVAIRPPTVPEGTSRIRFSLSAAHGSEDIARLCEVVPRLAVRQRAPA